MNSIYKAVSGLLFFVVISTLPLVSYAAAYPKSANDFAMLPPYCKVKLKSGSNTSQYKSWQARLRGFGHVHHYCAALHTVKLADRELDRNKRKWLLQSTISDFEYMQQHAPNTQLMPEILTQKGKVLLRLERSGEAIIALQKAVELKQDYVPAYIAIADYYISLGDRKSAREIVNQGLKFSPNSKGLKRRLDKLS